MQASPPWQSLTIERPGHTIQRFQSSRTSHAARSFPTPIPRSLSSNAHVVSAAAGLLERSPGGWLHLRRRHTSTPLQERVFHWLGVRGNAGWRRLHVLPRNRREWGGIAMLPAWADATAHGRWPGLRPRQVVLQRHGAGLDGSGDRTRVIASAAWVADGLDWFVVRSGCSACRWKSTFSVAWRPASRKYANRVQSASFRSRRDAVPAGHLIPVRAPVSRSECATVALRRVR